MQSRILIVEDEVIVRRSIGAIAQKLGCITHESGTLQLARQALEAEEFDVVLLDLALPDGDGMSLVREILRMPTPPEVIILTGSGNPDGAEVALKSGAWDFLLKPVTSKEMTLSLRRAIDYHATRKQVVHKVIDRCGIVGTGPEIMRCLSLVSRAAGSDASVVISGETGTGKELFARAIHNNSRRAEGKFVIVDCASLTESLLESTLFGSKKGAFTGSEEDRIGLIAQAHGGTLFLDEVSEMPVSMQKTFLRVLQERRYREVGGSEEKEVDFRLVSATNRNLEAAVAQGIFREDLLFRLRSIHIEIPPLRERHGGLRELVVHLIDRLSEKYKAASKGFTPDFMEMLSMHDWPGNVRELSGALEHAFSAAISEPVLYPIHLPLNVRVAVTRNAIGRRDLQREDAVKAGSNGKGELPPWKMYKSSAMQALERQYFQDLMDFCNGDITEAVRISGLHRARIYEILKSCGISKPT